MVTFDHYKEALALSEELRRQRIDDFADQIIRAMEQGSTGTEIFMALRWNIENLLNKRGHLLPKAIKNKARRLLEQLEKALQ